MLSDDSSTTRRLSDLRRALPADATLQNLLAVLIAKLEFCGRLPIYEYEAGQEGFTACAATLRELSDVERQSVHDLLVCLRGHLDDAVLARAGGHDSELGGAAS